MTIFSFISLLIPVFVIILAAITKKILPALITGLIVGGIFLAKGNIVSGVIFSVEYLVKSLSSEESIEIVLFLFVFGAFGEIMKVSGGIKGFSKISDRFVKTERGALGTVWIVSLVTFIDCCFHAIASGTIGKTLTDKVKGNRYKLAFIVNITSCLLIILIPFGTTYIGYIVGVIASSFGKLGIADSPYSVFMKSIPFNFYPIVMLLIGLAVTMFHFGFRKVDTNPNREKEVDDHHGHEAHEQCEFEEKAPPRPFNLILPLILLIVTTFFFFWYTSKDKNAGFLNAIINAQFEKSILLSSIVSLVLTSIFYLFQKIPLGEIESHFISGGCEMIPPIIVLILSWGLASIVQKLGFTSVITNMIGTRIPKYLIPASIFLIGCAASYFMGSAWGTWALMMPIAVPLAVCAHVSLPLIIAAVLSGGSLGDNASPLGETCILSANISEIPLMEHVRSQLPYCVVGIVISTFLFIVLTLF